MKFKRVKFNTLSPEEERIISDKDTERPGTGEYDNFFKDGLYLCRRCDTPLYKSSNKFDAHCGWPSFDQEIEGHVKRDMDVDGKRIEISCAACQAHLGHVFDGEKLTEKNTRHCVNSLSLKFVPVLRASGENQIAVFGGGCFWCLEAVFQRLNGVIDVSSGYSGGHLVNPRYEDVMGGDSGHAEVVNIEYNPRIISYLDLLEIFFEIHDPTTLNRQGDDIGSQYRSIILFNSESQWQEAHNYIYQLEELKTYKDEIVTEIKPLIAFYKAEEYHKDYYNLNDKKPYCRFVISPKIKKLQDRFGDKINKSLS